MDTAKAAIHDLEAVETRQGAVRQAVCTGSEQRPGCQNRRESSRPMAHRQQPRSELRVPQCLLRYAWTSQVVHWSLTQSVRTAGCGPACPVVWQGRAGDRSPYADFAANTSGGQSIKWARLGSSLDPSRCFCCSV